MHHYAHHIGDYRAHTAHLSMIEDGAYRRLLDLYYMHERPLPADIATCQRLSACRSKDERAAVDAILREFFTLEPDGWHQRRADEVVREYQSRSRGGAKGAESRWGTPKEKAAKTRAQRLSAARAKATHTPDEWAAVIEVFGARCVKCGTHRSELIGGTICKDHVVGIRNGGDDGVWNLQPMCRQCNTAKGQDGDYREDALPEWRKRLAERLGVSLATVNRKPVREAPTGLPVTDETSPAVAARESAEGAHAHDASRVVGFLGRKLRAAE